MVETKSTADAEKQHLQSGQAEEARPDQCRKARPAMEKLARRIASGAITKEVHEIFEQWFLPADATATEVIASMLGIADRLKVWNQKERALVQAALSADFNEARLAFANIVIHLLEFQTQEAVSSSPINREKRQPPAEELTLDTLCHRVESMQVGLRSQIEAVLQGLSGREFDSLEAKKEVAERINWLLRSADAKLECPKCGDPVYLQASRSGGARNGAFRFSHGGGRYHAGEVTFPENLQLAEK